LGGRQMNEFDLMIFLAERVLVLGADPRYSSGGF
jgi:hypothetical protein